MIDLLTPLGLTALAALAVPIVIHLLRRAQEHEVMFAALRWLGEREHPRTRLRLHERVLLALRLLLIAALALLLALPVWRGDAGPAAPWVVVAPGVSAATARAAVSAPAAPLRWLAPGFPLVDTTPAPARAPSLSLLRELDAALPASAALTVVVPRELGDLDGEGLRLGRAVDWRIVDGRYPESAPSPARDAPLRVAVRHAPTDDAAQVAVVAALARAWESAGLALALDVAAADAPLAADTQWLFWLGDDMPTAVAAWVEAGGVALVVRRADAAGRVLLADANGDAVMRERQQGRGRLLTTTAALLPDEMPALLAPDFPQRLQVLLSARAAPPDRALAAAVAPRAGAGRAPGPGLALDRSLALFAALIFLAERLWATRRREPRR